MKRGVTLPSSLPSELSVSSKHQQWHSHWAATLLLALMCWVSSRVRSMGSLSLLLLLVVVMMVLPSPPLLVHQCSLCGAPPPVLVSLIHLPSVLLSLGVITPVF